MRISWVALGLCLLVSASAGAQAPMPPTTVLADRVTFGQFVPRCQAGPAVLIVPAGQTITPGSDTTWDCIEVAGTLKISRTADTTLRVTTLLTLPGGILDEGTVADPIPASIHYRRITRDMPIDTTRDPFQWGNGLVNFGTHTAASPFKTPFVSLANDALAMESVLTLAMTPVGWQVGDHLVIPDTAPPVVYYSAPPRREADVTIVSVAGTQVVLSKPLDFSHLTVVAPNGTVVVHPIVANVTRNISIESENPFGTRGHQADIGDTACWDVRGTQVIGMGRTTIDPLDDTSADGVTHIGTNVRAKYAVHFHHVNMSCPSPRNYSDNVVQGVGSGKWGIVVHGTSDTTVADNITYDLMGAGIVTEDGYEVRNQFLRNLSAYQLLHTPTITSILSDTNIGTGQPGGEGDGFWWRGIMNVFDGNQAWDNAIGFNLIDTAPNNAPLVAGYYPSAPGVMPDVLFSDPNAASNGPFLQFTNQTAVGNGFSGLDMWGTKRAPVDGYVGANNYQSVSMEISQHVRLWLRNALIVGNFPTGDGTPAAMYPTLFYGGSCIESTGAYVVTAEIENSYLGGCGIGLNGDALSGTVVTNTTIQSAVGFLADFPQNASSMAAVLLTNVTFVPYGLHPHRSIMWTGTTGRDDGTFPVWDESTPRPVFGPILDPLLIGGTPTPPPPPPPPPVQTWTTVATAPDGATLEQLIDSVQGPLNQWRGCDPTHNCTQPIQ